MTKEIPMTEFWTPGGSRLSVFVILAWSFIRHSSCVTRHC
jgi:hypothetical protein